jgi:uncharacterized membrane-anchored protein YhcB (DUF1043 family)
VNRETEWWPQAAIVGIFGLIVGLIVGAVFGCA